MGLIMNGVEIPTDVANAFSFNGVNITKIIANGIDVWTQVLFSGTWSGSSKTYSSSMPSDYYLIFETSGSSFRIRANEGYGEATSAWVSAYSDGTFESSTESLAMGGYNYPIVISSGGGGETTKANEIELRRDVDTTDDYVRVEFNIDIGFTVVSQRTNNETLLETSAGSLRTSTDDVKGEWITLN